MPESPRLSDAEFLALADLCRKSNEKCDGLLNDLLHEVAGARGFITWQAAVRALTEPRATARAVLRFLEDIPEHQLDHPLLVYVNDDWHECVIDEPDNDEQPCASLTVLRPFDNRSL